MVPACSSYAVDWRAVGAGRPEGAPLLELPTKLVGARESVDGDYTGVVRWACPKQLGGLPYGPRSRPATRAGIRALPIWSAANLERPLRTAQTTGGKGRGSDTPGAGCGHQSLVLRSVWRSPMGNPVVRLVRSAARRAS